MIPDPAHRSARSAGASRRGRLLIRAALGLIALLAGVGLLARRAGNDPQPEAARTGQSEGPSPNRGAPGPAALETPGVEPAPRRFEPTICWQELERFDEAVTIERFRGWAAPLLAARDALIRDYLKERLIELIGDDAGHASTVLGWARDANEREFKVFMTALRDSEAVHQPQVAAQLLEMGLDSSLEPGRRAGILSALDTQKRLAPEALDRLARFAKSPSAGEAGWAATRTIGRVLKRDFEQTGGFTPYLDKLLTIGAESPDEQIRYLAQSMPMHVSALLDAQATERYAEILATEGNEDGRDAAAHNLALAQDKAKVLELFTRTFAREQAVCVRWALFRFAARVAGKQALPVMAEMARIDPRFQKELRLFEQIYASGTLDFVRVWHSLPDQDPYGCLHRHE